LKKAKQALRARVILAAVLTSLLAFTLRAQITFDAAASSSGSDNSTLSWSHTVGSGSNRLLVVGLSELIGHPPYLSATSVTYAGQPLTRQVLNGGNRPISEIWTLLSPPSGTATVVVTHPSTPPMVGGSVSFAGVDQTTPIRASTQARASAAFTVTVSASVTSNSGDVVIDAVADNGLAPGGTPAAGQRLAGALLKATAPLAEAARSPPARDRPPCRGLSLLIPIPAQPWQSSRSSRRHQPISP
jgi:hypothetical protein